MLLVLRFLCCYCLILVFIFSYVFSFQWKPQICTMIHTCMKCLEKRNSLFVFLIFLYFFFFGLLDTHLYTAPAVLMHHDTSVGFFFSQGGRQKQTVCLELVFFWFQALSLGLFRSDYFPHSTEENILKQVEMNTIASSLAQIATATSGIHRYVGCSPPNVMIWYLISVCHFDQCSGLFCFRSIRLVSFLAVVCCTFT